MTTTDLFIEYMTLNYPESIKESYSNLTRDIPLSSGLMIILRTRDPKAFKVIYMTTGMSVEIPKDWINIFSGFDTEFGHYLGTIEDSPEDKLSGIISRFLELAQMFPKIISRVYPGEDLIEILRKIQEIGTEDLRDWLREKFNCEVDPIIISTSLNEIEI